MNIEARPLTRLMESEFELAVNGMSVGELSIENDGRVCARLLLKDSRFLGSQYSAIFGYGMTNEEAFLDALKVGRSHHAAMGQCLAELEAIVAAEQVRQVQYS